MSTAQKSATVHVQRKTLQRTGRSLRPEGKSTEHLAAMPIGALLREAYEALRQTILDRLSLQGIEMTETEYSAMRFPSLDGLRPIDLARRCNATKQAMNYVLSGLEAKGYVRREVSPGRRDRSIFLTPKGWSVYRAMRKCTTDIERRWGERIGAENFEAVRGSLRELAVWLEKLEFPETGTPAKRGK